MVTTLRPELNFFRSTSCVEEEEEEEGGVGVNGSEEVFDLNLD
jgi:hypothetical protein